MKHFDTPIVDPAGNRNGVINVPADCETIVEAIAMATPGQTILFAEGEHTWKGKVDVGKALHFCGIRDKVTGFPAAKLKGRWRIKIPPPSAWDRNPQELCTFTNLLCESQSGYCMDISGGHVQMHNVRCFCKGGTAMAVSDTEVGMHGCILGNPKPSASYGLVVGNKGLVWMQQSVLRYCKIGAFMRETGILKMHLCEVHQAAHAFGSLVPNEAELEITNCRLAEIECKWHRSSRPSKLFQEANYDQHGEKIGNKILHFNLQFHAVWCTAEAAMILVISTTN